ncbi:Clavaminate synthase-like protein [Glarea lozoyensis ATCC 20868]|uniref:Trimethyllysine dioxygenase n=1 Tax=Glarea lozoyensis (strain ATCC 20868 / MF5171) TaxID=1116229 RepID=S3CHD2_GLAL2|nr:Clavaminate synthase-like protein [Glarea lozoyensis ATCC 20868]EPE25872.1 Clavaminate synthase-like protein [Glarea lozoyensis ATCC 20868]
MNAIWAFRCCGLLLRSPCAKRHSQRGLYALTRFSSTQTTPTPTSKPVSENARSSAVPLSEKVEFWKDAPRDGSLHPNLAPRYKAGDHIPENESSYRQSTRLYIRTENMTRKEGYSFIKLPHFWLRDSCRCRKCVNQDTMQKTFDTFSIPKDITPAKVTTEKEGLHIKWASEDGHESFYPWEWIFKNKYELVQNTISENQKVWGSEIASDPPSVHYDEIMANDSAMFQSTDVVWNTYGFCYVDGCPVSPERTKELLERIAFIRVTHYGGFYDFTSDLTMKDTAYTSQALAAHTDTAYFTDPAGLQMFHLLSHTEGTGGKSLLIDGFKAAQTLEREDEEAAHVLKNRRIGWHASGNDGITIASKNFTVLRAEILPNNETTVTQVRWNNDDRSTLNYSPTVWKWYDAARKFDEILKRKDMEYWAQLEPGRPLIFDNWRVLHGRSAFTGKRRICGGYINHDDYHSRWLNTNFSRSEVLDYTT